MAKAREKVELSIVASWDEKGEFNKETFKEEIERQGGTIISEDENEIVVQMDIYEGTIDLETKQLKDFGVSVIAINCEILPKQDIVAPSREIKIKATNAKDGIKSIKTPDGNTINASEVTYTASENGSYEFIILDNAGNEKRKTVTIKNIISPVIKINKEISPEEGIEAPYKNIKITAECDYYGIASIKNETTNKTINASEGTFTVENNGDYTFVITDKNGGEKRETITISGIEQKKILFSSSNGVGKENINFSIRNEGIPNYVTAGFDSYNEIELMANDLAANQNSGKGVSYAWFTMPVDFTYFHTLNFSFKEVSLAKDNNVSGSFARLDFRTDWGDMQYDSMNTYSGTFALFNQVVSVVQPSWGYNLRTLEVKASAVFNAYAKVSIKEIYLTK